MSELTPFTVGTYLRRRRLAQGVEPGKGDLELSTEVIEAIETDQREPTLAELGELMMAMELDVNVLVCVAAGGQAAVEATEECCRQCACSYSDPCQDPDNGPCAWSPTEDQLCTACEAKEAAE